WFLIISLAIFAVYIGWDLQIFRRIAVLDKSYMASLIIALVCGASVHCGWHIARYSRRITQLQQWLDNSVMTDAAQTPFLKQYLVDLSDAPLPDPTAGDNIVEIHADRTRAPVDLGWFFVDLAVRLGLLGTIIGFILIFSSLTNLDIGGGEDLKNLLIAMSGGMGTALLTTLSGLVGAGILSFQYLILGRESEHLVGMLVRVSHRVRHNGRTLHS
ncbi:MAG: MotA/TolQ/ExbB proton channel family protein, partial [Granulosicoccus sp.]|nr:MotA/TolQ/ExbB proton channel family protein [Granulosicoccus sp.]